jgi:protein-disulfide isomerase
MSLLMTVAPVVHAEIDSKQFEAAMEKYLASDKGQSTFGKTLETYMQRKQQEAMKKQEESQTAELEKQFENPVKIDVGSSPVRGPKNAKVTIVEFSDFQCPYCKRGMETMEEVLKMYPNDVKLVFKHLPLPFHPEAAPAARASYAAMKQGKFWEMHNALFENQRGLKAELYLTKAKELGLDIERFKKDMESEEAKAAVAADAELGKKNGIEGTPGFFVNGVAVKGAYPAEHFKKLIDRWLAKK